MTEKLLEIYHIPWEGEKLHGVNNVIKTKIVVFFPIYIKVVLVFTIIGVEEISTIFSEFSYLQSTAQEEMAIYSFVGFICIQM